MGVIERDPYTGHATTGHEWNGIKELNTAVPWPVWVCLIIAFLFAFAWWILMPAWPVGTTYTKGLLGANVRSEVAADLRSASNARAIWAQRIADEDFEAIRADPELMTRVREAGHALFGDNCAACHGTDAKGGPGFPNLTDDAWLWGSTPTAVFETIRVGVNSEHARSRYSQMPAWGRDKLIDRDAILNVVEYVYSLSHRDEDGNVAAEKLLAGEKTFMTFCFACHGKDAKGNIQVGAPDLTDSFWLYGGDKASIYEAVHDAPRGRMPTWESRLSTINRKILTLYVLDLGASSK